MTKSMFGPINVTNANRRVLFGRPAITRELIKKTGQNPLNTWIKLDGCWLLNPLVKK